MAGAVAGLPLDVSALPREVVSKREAEAAAKMELLLGGGEANGGTLTGTPKKKELKAATGKAYRALKSLVAEQARTCIDPTPNSCCDSTFPAKAQCNDHDLQHCGLVKVKARDGTVEWVAEESRAQFESGGSACLIWNRHNATGGAIPGLSVNPGGGGAIPVA